MEKERIRNEVRLMKVQDFCLVFLAGIFEMCCFIILFSQYEQWLITDTSVISFLLNGLELFCVMN